MTEEKMERDILLIVDKSGSMASAIQTAVMFGERIASRVTKDIRVFACDANAREILVEKGWKQAFAMIRDGGSTSLGSGLKASAEQEFFPSTVVCITDDAENAMPFYQDEALKNFSDSEHIFIMPGIGYPGGASYKTEQLGMNVHRYTVNLGDYSALDNVSKLLQQPPGKSIVDSILELDWPVTI